MTRGRRSQPSADLDTREFQRGLERAIRQWSADSDQEVSLTGQRIRNRAMRYSPVDTGNLRSGWQVVEGRDSKGFYVDVVNVVEYAAEVEKGSMRGGRRVAPAPMIIPALAEVLGMTGIGHDIEIRRET